MLQQFNTNTSSKEKKTLEMPLMGFGTFHITSDSIFKALEAGYRHLDLANGYGENEVSEALKKAFKPISQGGLGLDRKNIWLTMKAARGPFNEETIDSLLKRVDGAEYFDLFLIHMPKYVFDSEEQLFCSWRDLSNIDKNKVNRIGVSNFYEPHLSRLLKICDNNNLVKPYANQVESNLGFSNKSLIEYCHQHDIKVIAFSPLGFYNAKFILQNEGLKAFATEIHSTEAQAALAYLMTKDIAVIPASNNPEHIKENYHAVDFTSLAKRNSQLLDTNYAEGDQLWRASLEVTEQSVEHGQTLRWSVSNNKVKL